MGLGRAPVSVLRSQISLITAWISLVGKTGSLRADDGFAGEGQGNVGAHGLMPGCLEGALWGLSRIARRRPVAGLQRGRDECWWIHT